MVDRADCAAGRGRGGRALDRRRPRRTGRGRLRVEAAALRDAGLDGTNQNAEPRVQLPAPRKGLHRIRGKHLTSTMDNDEPGEPPYSLEDVPYVMYFRGRLRVSQRLLARPLRPPTKPWLHQPRPARREVALQLGGPRLAGDLARGLGHRGQSRDVGLGARRDPGPASVSYPPATPTRRAALLGQGCAHGLEQLLPCGTYLLGDCVRDSLFLVLELLELGGGWVVDVVAVADQVLQEDRLHLANLLAAPGGEVVRDVEEDFLDVLGQGVEPLLRVDDDARLVGVLRQDEVALTVVEALIPGRRHREERGVVEAVDDARLEAGHRVGDVDGDRARANGLVRLDVGDRLL